MGVGVMIGATLLGGFLQGRAARQQAQAQAKQAEANAQLAYQNAEKIQEQAELQAKNNAINEENKRRRILVQQGQQRANIGAAGIQASGSAAAALADNAFNAEQDLAIERYNGRQRVDALVNQSTDLVNQGDVYKANARQYRKAGKRAMMNAMLQSGLSLAGNLYAGNSLGKQKQAAVGGGEKWVMYSGNDIAKGDWSNGKTASFGSGIQIKNGRLPNSYGW